MCCRSTKKKGGQVNQALGRSRGGFSTKIHVTVDALGNPLRFVLTAGQCHDVTQAQALLVGYEFERVIADKGYDADHLRQFLLNLGINVVIPSTSRRKQPYPHDQHWYKERHLVECFINKVKHFRRIFSRFDKLASRFLGFLSFASSLIWLR